MNEFCYGYLRLMYILAVGSLKEVVRAQFLLVLEFPLRDLDCGGKCSETAMVKRSVFEIDQEMPPEHMPSKGCGFIGVHDVRAHCLHVTFVPDRWVLFLLLLEIARARHLGGSEGDH